MKKRRMPPLVMSWPTELPVREVRLPRGRPSHQRYTGQPWFDTGPHHQPLDFSLCVRRLLDDVVRRRPEWSHIQPGRILVCFTQASTQAIHGLQARVTPLRFKGGELQRIQRGHLYQIQRFLHGDVDFLYLMTFCLPRFLDQDFDHKMLTFFHELHHISPAFDGDLRRHEGRYHLHSHSKCEYDKESAEFARLYMSGNPDPALTAFLRLNFEQLRQRHGKVVGVVVPRPKLVPILPQPSAAAARADSVRRGGKFTNLPVNERG